MLVEFNFISWFLIELEIIRYRIKDWIFKFSSLRDFSTTVYRIKWTKSVADTRNPYIWPRQEAHRSVEDCLWGFLGITNFKRYTLETRTNARSATVGMGGSNFPHHSFGKQEEGETGLFHWRLSVVRRARTARKVFWGLCWAGLPALIQRFSGEPSRWKTKNVSFFLVFFLNIL